MEGSGSHLSVRSDGYVETAEGQFAVVMRVATRKGPETTYFEYDVNHGKETVRLEWNNDDQLQIFSQEVAKSMLSRGWALPPSPAAIAWANERFGDDEPPVTEAEQSVIAAIIAPAIPAPISPPPAKGKIAPDTAKSGDLGAGSPAPAISAPEPAKAPEIAANEVVVPPVTAPEVSPVAEPPVVGETPPWAPK